MSFGQNLHPSCTGSCHVTKIWGSHLQYISVSMYFRVVRTCPRPPGWHEGQEHQQSQCCGAPAGHAPGLGRSGAGPSVAAFRARPCWDERPSRLQGVAPRLPSYGQIPAGGRSHAVPGPRGPWQPHRRHGTACIPRAPWQPSAGPRHASSGDSWRRNTARCH